MVEVSKPTMRAKIGTLMRENSITKIGLTKGLYKLLRSSLYNPLG